MNYLAILPIQINPVPMSLCVPHLSLSFSLFLPFAPAALSIGGLSGLSNSRPIATATSRHTLPRQ